MSEQESRRGEVTVGEAARTVCVGLLGLLTLLLLAACIVPPVIFRLDHGRFPISSEQYAWASRNAVGLSAGEVLERLGEPHARHDEEDGGQRWYYWGDSYGFGYFGLRISRDGWVTYTWI